MILASVTMGNKAVSVNCEIGEFTVSRDDFDSLNWESAAERMGNVLGNNHIATREWLNFLLGFDKDVQFDVIRVFALSV